MTAAQPMPRRIHGLDLLRAAAILMVVAAHYPKSGSGGPLLRLLNFGWAGVDLFFVLSGYLIGRQVLQSFADGETIGLRRFYLSRLLRTLPCYYVILALYFVLAAFDAGEAPAPAWQFASFLQNFDIPNTFTPSWSLCVEEHFYAVFPIAILLFGRFGRRQDFTKYVAAILVFEVVLRAALWLAIRPDQMPPAGALHAYMTNFYYPTWCRLDAITLGVGLAALPHFHPQLWVRLVSSGNRLIAAGVFTFIGAVLVLWQRYSFLCCTLGFTLLSVSFCLFTAAALSERSFLSTLTIPGAATVATLSYSLYLTHALALEAGAALTRHFHISQQSLPGLAVVAALLAAFSALLYHGVERPFLSIRARLIGPSSVRRSPAAPPIQLFRRYT